MVFADKVKLGQVNWIGKSSGVEVDVDIVGGGKFSIFTTCIETIYGITFMVLAPENPLVDELKDRIKGWEVLVSRHYFTNAIEMIFSYALELLTVPIS